MAEKKPYNNKNGNTSVEEWVRMIHNDEIDSYMRRFKTSIDSCPPLDLIANDVFCFHCCDCARDCVSQVKEYKDYYLVKKVKYYKKDLDNLKEELDENK